MATKAQSTRPKSRPTTVVGALFPVGALRSKPKPIQSVITKK